MDKNDKNRAEGIQFSKGNKNTNRYLYEGEFYNNLPNGVGMLMDPEDKNSMVFKGIFYQGIPLYGSYIKNENEVYEGYLYYSD